jgi:hypothetical protein
MASGYYQNIATILLTITIRIDLRFSWQWGLWCGACGLVFRCQRFRVTNCLHLQGWSNDAENLRLYGVKGGKAEGADRSEMRNRGKRSGPIVSMQVICRVTCLYTPYWPWLFPQIPHLWLAHSLSLPQPPSASL